MKTRQMDLSLVLASLSLIGCADSSAPKEDAAPVVMEQTGKSLKTETQDPEKMLNATIADHVGRYTAGQIDPVEAEVYEMTNPATGQTEKYIKRHVPVTETDPYSYADDQDAVKPVETKEIYQQIDGPKVDTVENSEHHYRSSGGYVRYYPYGSSYSGSGYHGYYTPVTDPVYNPADRHAMHNEFSRTGQSMTKPVGRTTAFKAIQGAKTGFLSKGSMAGSSRMGGTRGGFGRATVSAGG